MFVNYPSSKAKIETYNLLNNCQSLNHCVIFLKKNLFFNYILCKETVFQHTVTVARRQFSKPDDLNYTTLGMDTNKTCTIANPHRTTGLNPLGPQP